MSNTPISTNSTTKPVEVYKLAPSVYAELERVLGANMKYPPKTEIDAAYRCGVNDVLLMLRGGFVG